MGFQGSKPYDRTMADLPEGAEIGAPMRTDEEPMVEGSLRDETGEFNDAMLVAHAQRIFSHSTDYMNVNVVHDWERSLAHFSGHHGPETRYVTEEGQRRSRVFRPKTRANVKSQEAGLATAMFSTTNLVNVTPHSPSDPGQTAAAAMAKELLQYRLEETMPWVLTVQGAFQDTKVYGICISHQYWQLREEERIEPVYDEMGMPLMNEEGQALGQPHIVAVEDNLKCDNVEPENFRFDPLCDWRDPAGTSSFVIMVKPMRVVEAEAMMKKNGGTWENFSRAAIVSAGTRSGDRARRAREGNRRVDPAESHGPETLTTVWAHMNIVRDKGEDWVYWTMGTTLLLTKPEKLMDTEPWLKRGERPFVVGISSFETHKNYPDGDVRQLYSLQQELNEVANQRIDNVRLAMNRRYHLKRGARVDLQALLRNTPGGGVYMDNPETDVKEIVTPDVTASSYREQEVLSQEADQLVGGFDMIKAASDGASPGGIARAGAASSAIKDYGVFLFVVTWVRPVLRQLLRLVQHYETDEAVMAIAAERAGQVGEVTDDLLTQDLILRVDAGIGTLDPLRKVERLANGLALLGNVPSMADRMKPMQVADEVMGALGYQSAERFFLSDEEWEQVMSQQEPQPSEVDVKMQELEIRREDNMMRNERESLKEQNKALLQQLELQQKASEEAERRNQELMRMEQTARTEAEKRALEAEKAVMDNQTKRDIAAVQAGLHGRDTDVKTKELSLRSAEVQEKRRQTEIKNREVDVKEKMAEQKKEAKI